MNVKEQQTIFKEMGVKTFYIGKSIDIPQKATIIFQRLENFLYDIYMITQSKFIFVASGHTYPIQK